MHTQPLCIFISCEHSESMHHHLASHPTRGISDAYIIATIKTNLLFFRQLSRPLSAYNTLVSLLAAADVDRIDFGRLRRIQKTKREKEKGLSWKQTHVEHAKNTIYQHAAWGQIIGQEDIVLAFNQRSHEERESAATMEIIHANESLF